MPNFLKIGSTLISLSIFQPCFTNLFCVGDIPNQMIGFAKLNQIILLHIKSWSPLFLLALYIIPSFNSILPLSSHVYVISSHILLPSNIQTTPFIKIHKIAFYLEKK
jgi:hypothetical protein